MLDSSRHHRLFTSSYNLGDSSPWQTTISNNQKVNFLGYDGGQLQVNSLTITSNSTDLIIQIGDKSGLIIIPANQSITLDYIAIESITITGILGQQFRYYALSF